jgi:hypothetical protein
MMYRIIDIIADRDFEAMASVVAVIALLVGAALLGWLIMAS